MAGTETESTNAVFRLLQNVSRKKNFSSDEETYATPLRRFLGTWDLTLLGIGSMFGAGLYVLTGVVARQSAGPAVFICYFIAGFASLLAALCYAEFSCRIPRTGSAYLFTYVTIGEIWAFLIGWNLILEYAASAASVGRSFSGYVDALCNHQYSNFTITYILGGEPWDVPFIASYPDILGAGFCLFIMIFVLLGVGTSAWMNNIFLIINLVIVGLIVGLGIKYADISNWQGEGGIAPFGVEGIIAGAATCFYSYVGFDIIAISSEETVNPKKSIPIAMILSVSVITVCYVAASAVLTLMVPYPQINESSAFAEAFALHGVEWAKWVVGVGAISAMFTCILTSLFCLPRSIYAMASDGLLFEFLAKVNERTQVPLTAGIIFGIFVALLDTFLTLTDLVNFLSIGVLTAYGIVAGAVIVLRYSPGGYGINYESVSGPMESDMTQFGKVDTQPIMTAAEVPGPDDAFSIYTDTIAGTLKEQYRTTPIIWRLYGYEPGSVVLVAMVSGVILEICAIALMLHGFTYILTCQWWAILLVIVFSLSGIVAFCLIPLHYENDPGENFSVPFVPLIPIMSILFNGTLMLKLGMITWIRFVVWIVIGLLIYKFYGYSHSKVGLRIKAIESIEMLERHGQNGHSSPQNGNTSQYGSIQQGAAAAESLFSPS